MKAQSRQLRLIKDEGT